MKLSGIGDFVVVDVECTCWQQQKHPHEIIEIGAVLYRPGVGIVSDFQTYVRPKNRPEISQFCTDLTGIEQDDIEDAPSFPVALSHLSLFGGKEMFMVSWGDFDRNQFLKDCRNHYLEVPFVGHLNLRRLYTARYNTGMISLAEAVEHSGLSFEGRQHSGLDDAVMTAKLADRIVREEFS